MPLTQLLRAINSGNKQFMINAICDIQGVNGNIQHVLDTNNKGESPLMCAIKKGNTYIAQILIGSEVTNGQGAELDFQVPLRMNQNGMPRNADIVGKTALMYAAKHGYRGVVEMLIESGVNMNLTDDQGNTAELIAANNGHYNIVVIIQAAVAQLQNPQLQNFQPQNIAEDSDDTEGNDELLEGNQPLQQHQIDNILDMFGDNNQVANQVVLQQQQPQNQEVVIQNQIVNQLEVINAQLEGLALNDQVPQQEVDVQFGGDLNQHIE
jgi:ankyrin repeat protein